MSAGSDANAGRRHFLIGLAVVAGGVTAGRLYGGRFFTANSTAGGARGSMSACLISGNATAVWPTHCPFLTSLSFTSASVQPARVGSVAREICMATWGEFGLADNPKFECAGMLGQIEAVRAGAGVGVLHDYAVRNLPDLVRVLPDRRVTRTYWIVTHDDVRDLARVRLVHDFMGDLTHRLARQFI